MANNENLIPIPGRLHSVATEGHVSGANEIYDDTQQKDQETINSELIAAVGTGGSVDSRIAAAVNVEKTRAEGAESTLTTNLGNEVTRATNAENALDGRVDTLEDAVGTGGSVDSRISSAVATETTRAQAAEADRYTKSETYSKTELNNMITTPNQEYVSVNATSQTTAVTDVLPATGAADTTYRVGNWDGTQYNDSVFSEYAWDGTAYIKLSTKSQIGEVYDISANHADTKYADLAAALNGGNNIPQSLQKGGMSIKFIQSSDNKYVQFRYMSSSTDVADFTNVNNWQNMDTDIHIAKDIKFIEIKEDANHKVLEGITKDGRKIEYLPTEFKEQTSFKSTSVADTITSSHSVLELIDAKEDNAHKIVEGTRKNGNKVVIGLEIGEPTSDNNTKESLEKLPYIDCVLDKSNKILESTDEEGNKRFYGNVRIDGTLQVDYNNGFNYKYGENTIGNFPNGDSIGLDSVSTAINGTIIDNQLVASRKQIVNNNVYYSHASIMCVVDNISYVAVICNDVDRGDSPLSPHTYVTFAVVPLSIFDDDSIGYTELIVGKPGDYIDGAEILSGVSNPTIVQVDNDTIRIVFTCKTENDTSFANYYRDYTISTGTLGAIAPLYIGNERMTTESVFALAGVTSFNPDVCWANMNVQVPKGNDDYYYCGVCCGANIYLPSGMILRSLDMIHYELWLVPTFTISSLAEDEAECFCSGNYLYYALRQATNREMLIAKFNLTTKALVENIMIPDARARSCFVAEGNNLYLIHNRNNRQSYEVIRINKDNLWQSSIVSQGIASLVYPSISYVNNNFYMSCSSWFNKVSLRKVKSLEPITRQNCEMLIGRTFSLENYIKQ